MNKYHTYDFLDCKYLVVCGDIHGDFNLLVNKICVQYHTFVHINSFSLFIPLSSDLSLQTSYFVLSSKSLSGFSLLPSFFILRSCH